MLTDNARGAEARAAGNDIGIVRLSDSIVTGNTIGLQVGLGAIFSRENNTIAGNGTDVDGVLSPLPPL